MTQKTTKKTRHINKNKHNTRNTQSGERGGTGAGPTRPPAADVRPPPRVGAPTRGGLGGLLGRFLGGLRGFWNGVAGLGGGVWGESRGGFEWVLVSESIL